MEYEKTFGGELPQETEDNIQKWSDVRHWIDQLQEEWCERNPKAPSGRQTSGKFNTLSRLIEHE